MCCSGERKRCGWMFVSVGVVGVCAVVVKGSGVGGCVTVSVGVVGVCAIVVKGRGVDV